jgi:signal transduction histidine kinase
MLRSLRFKLPAIFLTAIVLAALVSTALAVRLFQQYTQNRTRDALRREARGIAALYVDMGLRGLMETFRGETMSEATGDLVYYAPRALGVVSFPGQAQPLRTLPPLSQTQVELLDKGRTLNLTIDPPGPVGPLLAAAAPVRVSHTPVLGAVVVGTPRSQLRSSWLTLIDRLALAFAGGIVVSAALAWYLSRRITRPLLALSDAADEISRGSYDVDVPKVRGGDEIGHLSGRFREMAARLAEAEQRERNFLMSVSHELRTPLTAIRGHVSAIREGLIDDPELEEQSLAIVQSETERLERLVQDVLDLAKLDAHRFSVQREEVDMEVLVERAYGAFAEEARRREIDYRLDLDAAPVITTDGDRVLQIISNLLANAFRWTPDGGRIALELTLEDHAVSVAVEDSGPGISREEQERIFRPFWSRDDAGTGLGLAIARELSHALGGRIYLSSEPGFGSRFELQLPAGHAAVRV